jgi:transcription elongation factor SPT6
MAYAEQFSDPDASIAQPPDELLRRARMILSTELGKDPLLRHAVRDLFKREAIISVLPTDRGISKIDEHHEYFVSLLSINFSCNVLCTFLRISNTFTKKR